MYKEQTIYYLESIIHQDGEMNNYTEHGIKDVWLKWYNASEFLHDCYIPIKLNGKFSIRPTIWVRL